MKKLLSCFIWSCGLMLASSSLASAQLYDFAEDVIDAIEEAQGSTLSSEERSTFAENMEANDINDSSWIVGHVAFPDGDRQLFVWTPGGDVDLSSTNPYPSARVYLLSRLRDLEAVAISNNGTVIYNYRRTRTNPESGTSEDIDVGAFRRFTDGVYEDGQGTDLLLMRDISESWIAADFIETENFNICGFQIDDIFVQTSYTRAYAFDISGGQGPVFNRPIGFATATACNLSSRSYAIKASPDNRLLYVAGESFGLGQGQSRLVDARGMLYSRNENGNFVTSEVLDGDPGQVRGINSYGNYTGAWFTARTGQIPNSLRAFYTGAICSDNLGLPLPYIDLIPDRNAQGNAINDANWVVGTFRTQEVSRGFVYQPLACTDENAPIPDEDGNFVPTDLRFSFKDLTEYARELVGIEGWQLLGPGQAINEQMQVVGNRGVDVLGNERPYLVNLSPCEALPARDMIVKGGFDPVADGEFAQYNALMSRFEVIFNEEPYASIKNEKEVLTDLFLDNDDNEGTGASWFVNENPDFGPGGPATLLTNTESGYRNNAQLEIRSRRVFIPGTDVPPISFNDVPPPLPTESVSEAYITFKFWSHQENGDYDKVIIQAKEFGKDQPWAPLAEINYTSPNLWNDYVLEVSEYIGLAIQLRFLYLSDQCITGDGVLFKDFEMVRVAQETQNVLFPEFLELLTSEDLQDQIESLADDPDIKLSQVFGSDYAVPTTLLGTTLALPAGPTTPTLGVNFGLKALKTGFKIGGLVALGVTIAALRYEYLNAAQPVETIILNAPPATLSEVPNLEEWLANKRQVFFNGMTQLTSDLVPDNVRLAHYAMALNGLLEIQDAALTGATNGEPAYAESFSNSPSKRIRIVIPTHIGTISNINNNRLMFKRFFAELALITKSITVDVYVYDTYADAFYEVTTNNPDYLNAYKNALKALHWAHDIVIAKDQRRTNPSYDALRQAPVKEDEVSEVDFRLPLTLTQDQGCTDIVISPQNPDIPEPEREFDPVAAPVVIAQDQDEGDCGSYSLILTNGRVKRPGDEDVDPNTSCRGISASANNQGVNPIQFPLNVVLGPDGILPSGAFFAVLWEMVVGSNGIIRFPEADHYLDGTEISLVLDEDYTFESGTYKNSITQAEMLAAGLLPTPKKVEIEDRDPNRPDVQFVIDNIIFEQTELTPLRGNEPYFVLPQDGRYELEVCAIHNASGEAVSDGQNNHVLSSLLHRINEDRSQNVVADLAELDNEKNIAIFMPGYATRSYLTDPTLTRRYGHEDLSYDNPGGLFGIGSERLRFLDNWTPDATTGLTDWDTYVYQTPAYLEPGPFLSPPTLQEAFERISRRFFTLDEVPRGVAWFDSWKKDNRDNTFSDVENDPSPTIGLVEQDIEYLEEVLDEMAGALQPFRTNDRVVAIYGENISATRALLAMATILEESGDRYDNLRIVIGLLDPVWPEVLRLPDGAGDFTTEFTDDVLGGFVDDLSGRPNVTVFTAHTRSPIYQRQVFGDMVRTTWLLKTLDYDLTALDRYRGENRQLLLKYFFALGHEGLINLTRCSATLENVVSPFLGIGSTVTGDDGTPAAELCYSTARPGLGAEPLQGYFGPTCENLRQYFAEGDRRSYRLRAWDFTGPGNLFENIEEQNAEQLQRFVLQLINPTPEVENFMDNRITNDDD